MLTVPETKAGTRLDKFLADTLCDISRVRVKALLDQGAISRLEPGRDPGNQDDKSAFWRTIADASYRVKSGENYRVLVPPATDAKPPAQAIDLSIAYEDDDLIVVDKPAGLVVHPAPGNPDRTLVNALLAHCGESLSGIGGVKRPGIVHRIDKDTSGLLVVAKNDIAHRGLAEQFEAHSLIRAYTAVVWGSPTPAVGTITGNIGRSPANRIKMAVVPRGGKEATTHYRILQRIGKPDAKQQSPFSLVECRLETGRTHQIRVHMAHSGHPLLGDPLYGTGRQPAKDLPAEAVQAIHGFSRQALHARLIGFIHPISGKALKFHSETPNDISELIEALEKY